LYLRGTVWDRGANKDFLELYRGTGFFVIEESFGEEELFRARLIQQRLASSH